MRDSGLIVLAALMMVMLGVFGVLAAMEHKSSAIDCCGIFLATTEAALPYADEKTRAVLLDGAARAGYRCEPQPNSTSWRCR